jgi:polyphosphate glucokinase
MEILGIDVGGSGIKGAIVNTFTGEIISERHRIPTPKPAKPKSVAKSVKLLVHHFKYKGPIGCAFPTVIDNNGISKTQGNIHKKWINCDVRTLFSNTCKLPFIIKNDADAAGIAEMTFGEGIGKKGTVILVTIGTGLGTGVFRDGLLIPNIELGRIFHKNGEPIEFFAADSARKRENLSIKKWSQRFDFFLNHVNRVFSPDLFIIGGGISKKFEEFKDYFTVPVPIVVAATRNNAGIIGAAMAASELSPKLS